MYSNNYLYRRPSNASDSSSVTLTDDKCYGINNSPYSSSYNNYNSNNYNAYDIYNSPYFNAIDEEYKNLPYASSYSNSDPLTINRNFSGNYNNYRYKNNNYNNNYGSSSFPTYSNSNYYNNYENNRRNSHYRSLSVGNTPSYGSNNYNYEDESDDGVYRSDNNNNYIYITRSSSNPSGRRMKYNSGGNYLNSYSKRNNHNNPIDYLDLSVNCNNYSDNKLERRKRRSRINSKLGSDYYPYERKKGLLENITSKFRKLRFSSDKYEDDQCNYYDTP
ncbi:hypothetical protein BCR36DRAFT_293642 [Piromyces finnis]|uniref:Uncharacterized protein n=1 Tax=Piromyces finnis TaxID=1754191 RepID=A0A1Y1V6L2_9FUNG|nr:hypothetical protein BCR36DRAFT_293642 [Piromyces finnis]|eukprot:ORX48459.1 hypothetical protein BCR36DRAFT_293642 [Piromyces finnis]